MTRTAESLPCLGATTNGDSCRHSTTRPGRWCGQCAYPPGRAPPSTTSAPAAAPAVDPLLGPRPPALAGAAGRETTRYLIERLAAAALLPADHDTQPDHGLIDDHRIPAGYAVAVPADGGPGRLFFAVNGHRAGVRFRQHAGVAPGHTAPSNLNTPEDPQAVGPAVKAVLTTAGFDVARVWSHGHAVDTDNGTIYVTAYVSPWE